VEEVAEVLCARETGAKEAAAKAVLATSVKTPRDMRFMCELLGEKYAQGVRKVPKDSRNKGVGTGKLVNAMGYPVRLEKRNN
jgi:hypothetical protein